MVEEAWSCDAGDRLCAGCCGRVAVCCSGGGCCGCARAFGCCRGGGRCVCVVAAARCDLFLRMRPLEKLRRNLAEIVDKADGRVSRQRIGYTFKIDVRLVEQMMIDVVCRSCGFALLFVAENEVDPIVEMLADVVAFERLKTLAG